MAKNLFNRYIWLINTIYSEGRITFEEINKKWKKAESLSNGDDMPIRTFHNYRRAIEEMFDINIDCDKRNNYAYYIDNRDDIEKNSIRKWLLNTFAVNNLINESHRLKRRILFEEIPSGQRFLMPVIEAMRDGLIIKITHRSYWQEHPTVYVIEPYCLKIFRQRWFVLARNRSGELKVYSLDRIQSLQKTENGFAFPDNFDAQKYFHDYFGIITGAEKPCVVEIKVFGRQCEYVRSLPLHHSQEETEKSDNYSIFRYCIAPTFDFRQEILSHGAMVEVLSPKELRKEIAATIKKMKGLYR
jgi:hypothetical protein